jgi:NAD-dependent deacetylase
MKFKDTQSIVILTGAGISAESGLKTFRDNDGLWENHRVEDVATPEAFQANPELVQSFYNERRAQLQEPKLKPNAGHIALAELEKFWKGSFLLVTQNVDNLHERAGSKNILHMHGELLKARDVKTQEVQNWTKDLNTHATPNLRPHIVWFGEMPLFMNAIDKALEHCDIFISIGTSGNVYPAAGFVNAATKAYKIEVNLEPSLNNSAFDLSYIGKGSVEIPKLLQDLLHKA